jgi:uncharacterized SAM-binding protein YcdF (DUF218 family)
MLKLFTKMWDRFLRNLRAEFSSYNFGEIGRRLRRLLALLSIIWFASFLLFYAFIPTSVQLPKIRKDAAVVLTGGANRIDMGFRLLENKLVKNLFISGVAKSNKQKNFAYYFEKYGIEDKARVKLGYYAQNTEDNAIETKLYLQLKNYEDFYLITSSYHVARSWLLFTHFLPEYGFKIIPVVSSTYDKYSLKGIYISLKEYHKCLYIVKDILVEKLYTQYVNIIMNIAEWIQK